MQGLDEDSPGPPAEEVLDAKALEEEAEGEPSIMPWLVPILVIAAFFAFVALLVLFLV